MFDWVLNTDVLSKMITNLKVVMEIVPQQHVRNGVAIKRKKKII